MTEINLFPKFIDEAASPVAESVGETLSSVWDIVFGGIDFYSKKKNFEREQALQDFKNTLDKKVTSIPPEKLIEPELHVIGPIIEASKFHFENKILREMFSNLLVSSMHDDLKNKAHPSFVEVIKQLSPDEAKIIQSIDGSSPIAIAKLRLYSDDKDEIGNYHFSEPLRNFSTLPYEIKCTNPDSGTSYLENLSRLGLISLSYSIYNTNPKAYESIENHSLIKAWKQNSCDTDKRFELNKGALTRTSYGKNFYESCITTL